MLGEQPTAASYDERYEVEGPTPRCLEGVQTGGEEEADKEYHSTGKGRFISVYRVLVGCH